MSYQVNFSLEAVNDVLRITLLSQTKAAVISASQDLQNALKYDPANSGQHLSEGLYCIDCAPLRAFYIISVAELQVEIVNVKHV